MTRVQSVLACAAACLAAAAPASASGPAGSLTQLTGDAGCITDDGMSNSIAAQCADGRGLLGAEAVLLSPDGKFAYSYSYDNGQVAILARDPATGALTQADDTGACIGPANISGDCSSARYPGAQSDSAHAIALSPDGRFLFTVGYMQPIVGVFARDATTGALAELPLTAGCTSHDGTDWNTDPSCDTFAPLDHLQAVAVSPDGKFVYVSGDTATGGGITAFSVGPTGALTPLTSPDGCLKATALTDCTVARYARDIYDIALSPDGHTLYGVDDNDDAVVAFARDAGTGKLTQIAGAGGCVFEGGAGPDVDPCTPGHALAGVQSVEVSPDGTLVTVGTSRSSNGGGVVVLHRDPATGQLSQSDGAAGCVANDVISGCGVARQVGQVYRTLFAADGKTLFVASYAGGSANPSGVSIFDVGADGALTQRVGALGCFSDTGTDSAGTAGGCTTARAVRGTVGLASSPDGNFLYAASYGDNGVATFGIQHAPACSDATASTAFGTAVTIPVTCTDANGDTVTLSGVDGPGHGTVAFSGLTATYTPAAGFSGADSFRVKGNDGANDSTPATVSVTVGAAQLPPPAGKKAPLKLSLAAKPKRDKKLPFKFTFSGKLTPAAGAKCSGKVVLTVKHGKKKVAKKTATLKSSCKWKAVVKFSNRKKLGKKRAGKLSAKARYGGNAAMTAKSSKTLKVRYG
jgi:WD40 repeat protein